MTLNLAFALFLSRLRIIKYMERIVIGVFRVDAVAGEAAAQAVGTIVHGADGVDNAGAVLTGAVLVEDTGEGMSEEMQTRLFQPFEQESATTAQKHGGSGLGLSIAKNFVELMSGSISVKSKKGEGTTFVVSIPFEFEQAAEPEITEQPVENDLSVVQEEQAVYDFTGKKVLLAEDTAFNEEVATELLAMVHMDVDCAHNGKEAVELFEKAKPGTYMAILMDIHMPVMNGYEAARTIRKSEREDAGTIAIYAMTANSFEEDVSAALNAGMNGHIAKPVDAEKVKKTILSALSRQSEQVTY